MKAMVKFGLFCLLLLTTVGAMAAGKAPKKILIVVTSADRMTSGKPTGLWLEEFAVPYLEFLKNGYQVTVASPKGGSAPVDARSNPTSEQARAWSKAILALRQTVPVAGLSAQSYDAIYIPGGHGAVFDLPQNKALSKLISDFDAEKKVVAAVCHGPAAFVGVKRKDGKSLVAGRTLTSFTDSEEAAVGLTKDVPFLLQSKLAQEGGNLKTQANFTSYALRDGNLITGQNPASSLAAAKLIIQALSER